MLIKSRVAELGSTRQNKKKIALPDAMAKKEAFSLESFEQLNRHLRLSKPSRHTLLIHDLPACSMLDITLGEGHAVEEEIEELCLVNEGLHIEFWADRSQLIIKKLMLSRAISAALSRHAITMPGDSESGFIYCGNAGFWLPNGSLYVPDVCYLPKHGAKKGAKKRRTTPWTTPKMEFFKTLPTILAEVVPGGDKKGRIHIEKKMRAYMKNGVEVGGVQFPGAASPTIYKRSVDGFPVSQSCP